MNNSSKKQLMLTDLQIAVLKEAMVSKLEKSTVDSTREFYNSIVEDLNKASNVWRD